MHVHLRVRRIHIGAVIQAVVHELIDDLDLVVGRGVVESGEAILRIFDDNGGTPPRQVLHGQPLGVLGGLEQRGEPLQSRGQHDRGC